MSRIITPTRTGSIITDTDLGIEYLYVGDYGKENNIKASFLGFDKFRNKEGPLEYLIKKLIEYIEKVPYSGCDGCIYDELIYAASVCSECCRNYHDEYQPKEDKDE